MTEAPPHFEYRHSKELAEAADVEGLINALGHQDVQRSRFLRGRVVRDLGELSSPRAIPALARVLASDPDPACRCFAARALGMVEDQRSLSALRDALRDRDRNVRIWAIESLGLLRDREGVEKLIDCLGDEDKWIREKAVRALGKIGDHRATSPLISRLGDRKALVRKAAASAFLELRDWNAIDPVRQAHARAGPLRRRSLQGVLQGLEDSFR